MKTKLNTLTLAHAIKKLKAKEISHKELYADIWAAIKEKNNSLNIYLTLDKKAAEKAEKLLNTPLAGVPIAVKDNYLTVGLPTTASSNVLKGFMSPYESTVTARIKKAGGVVIGKTNLDAFAHGSSTETSDFGATKNPRNSDYLPGGSSGGSTAAIAADFALGAVGSETAGSTRLPAAWCGVVGLKPTYGRVSRAGIVPMASSLDSPGPIAKTVEDTAILMNTFAGADQYDGTSVPRPAEDFTSFLKKDLKGMRVGICYIDHEKLKGTPAALAVIEAGKVMESLGAIVSEVETSESLVPGKILAPDYAIAVYTVVQRSEVSSNLARFDGVRYGQDRSHLGAEAKRRIMLGTFTLSSGYADKYYIHASKVRSLYLKNFRDLFKKFDILISPTTAGYAPKIGTTANNPMFGEIEDMLEEPTAVAGCTGITVPCFHDPKTNLYLGVNICANNWQEGKVFQAGYAYEQMTKWNSWTNV